MNEARSHQHGKGNEMQPCQCFRQPFVVTSHPPKSCGPGETAIVLFSKETPNRSDDKFVIRPNGSGWSGNWKRVSSYGQADKVIIYYRPPNRGSNYGEIFVADYEDMVASPEAGRLRVKFQGAKRVGTTSQNWLDFAGKGQTPTGYIRKGSRVHLVNDDHPG